MLAPFVKTAKVSAVALGGWLGYVVGWLISYYSVDRGDVGSASALILWGPVGVLICSIAAYVIATKTLSNLK